MVPVWYLLWFLVMMGIETVIGWFVNLEKPVKKPGKFFSWINAGILRHRVIFLNVGVKLVGKEKLPAGKFVLAYNHRSSYDPAVIFLKLRRKMICITQKDEDPIPANEAFLRKSGFMQVEKPGVKTTERVLNQAAAWLKDGVADVCVAPEGKVSRDGNLQAFRPVALQAATRARAPIVVAVLAHTEKIQEEFFLKRKHVTLTIAGVITPEEYEGRNLADIGILVRRMMKSALEN